MWCVAKHFLGIWISNGIRLTTLEWNLSTVKCVIGFSHNSLLQIFLLWYFGVTNAHFCEIIPWSCDLGNIFFSNANFKSLTVQYEKLDFHSIQMLIFSKFIRCTLSLSVWDILVKRDCVKLSCNDKKSSAFPSQCYWPLFTGKHYEHLYTHVHAPTHYIYIYIFIFGERCMTEWKKFLCDAFPPLGLHRTKFVYVGVTTHVHKW